LASVSKEEIQQACHQAVERLPDSLRVRDNLELLEQKTVEVVFSLLSDPNALQAIGETYSASPMTSGNVEVSTTFEANVLYRICTTVAEERALILLQASLGDFDEPLSSTLHTNHATRELRRLQSVAELPSLLRKFFTDGILTQAQYLYGLQHLKELMQEDSLALRLKNDAEHMPEPLRIEALRQDRVRRDRGIPYECLLKMVCQPVPSDQEPQPDGSAIRNLHAVALSSASIPEPVTDPGHWIDPEEVQKRNEVRAGGVSAIRYVPVSPSAQQPIAFSRNGSFNSSSNTVLWIDQPKIAGSVPCKRVVDPSYGKGISVEIEGEERFGSQAYRWEVIHGRDE